jgi:hypothetical protein
VYRQSLAAKTFHMNNPNSIHSSTFDIPGLNLGLGTSSSFAPSFSFGHYDAHIQSAPVSPLYMPPQHQSLSMASPEPSYSLPMHPAQIPPPTQQSTPATHSRNWINTQLPYDPAPLPMSPPERADPFRFNGFCYGGYSDPHAASILACQTNIFRK